MIWKIYLSSGIKTRYSSHVPCLLTIQDKEDFGNVKKQVGMLILHMHTQLQKVIDCFNSPKDIMIFIC